MFYSPSLRGFFDPAIHERMPPDAVPITTEHHAALLDAQSRGAQITADENGAPTAQWPLPPSLEELRAEAKAKVLAWAAEFGRTFTTGYTAEEVASWGNKAEAARAHLAGTPQPMILAEAAVTGETPTALAQAILTRAGVYTVIVAKITGLRRATFAAIDAARTPKAVDAALATALTRAQALVAELTASVQTGN